MDVVKQPAMALSIINTVTIIGTTGWFYKQITSLQAEQAKINELLATTIKKLEDHQKVIIQIPKIIETLKNMNIQINELKKAYDEISEKGEELDEMKDLIDNITDTLNDNGISVDQPRKSSGSSRSRKNRKNRNKSKTKGTTSYSSRSEDEHQQQTDDDDIASVVSAVRNSKK
jgi:Tfp pilus assembly protein PilO